MTLSELLAENGIRTALVVDDACDVVPTAADMRMAADEWAQFSDDLSPEQTEIIASVFSNPSAKPFGQLINDDDYVAAVWKVRSELGEIADQLFQLYDANQATDQDYLSLVKDELERLSVTVTMSGRSFAEEELTADLVVIDLYLGSGQDESALKESKELLRAALATRTDSPPLVILMSRSGNLEAKRDEYRDEVGLIDSGFRIVSKLDLQAGVRFPQQLERLARNAEDTRRLARFFGALEGGLREAATRTVALMRRLKLSDIGQIQQLLLDLEGESPGSYLVEVFDRVLQHEVEAESQIIDAARELNKFSSAQHPPPYVAGSVELQQLVQRMLTQNARRLELPGSLHALVSFGDVLRLSEGTGDWAQLALDLPAGYALLVVTPACDLQRAGAPRILTIAGAVENWDPKSWRYGPKQGTSPVQLNDSLYSLKWNTKHFESLEPDKLKVALATGLVEVVARLRESHTLEVQQRALAELGRVGLVASMPATFSVDLEAYVPDQAGVLVRLDVPELADEGAVCFVGRDQGGDQVVKLVLTEASCDGLCDAIQQFDLEQVHEKARVPLGHLQTSNDLSDLLLPGLDLKQAGPEGWKQIGSLTGGQQIPKVGLMAWNLIQDDQPLTPNELKHAGIVLLVKDQHVEGALGRDHAVRIGAVTENAVHPAEDEQS